MKRHKLLNIRNERLLNKLFENQGLKYESAKPWEKEATDEETIKWIRETFGRDTHRDIDKSAWRIDTSFFAYLDKLITDKKAADDGDVPRDERHQGYVWKQLHQVSLKKLLSIQPVLKAEYGSDKGDLGGFRAGTEPPPESAQVFREEEKEEESSGELNLLRQISDKLDTLKDLDTSIDYLASVLSGEDTLSVGMRQKFFGRGVQAEPVKLKKEIKEFIEGKSEEDAEAMKAMNAEADAMANRIINSWKNASEKGDISDWVLKDVELRINKQEPSPRSKKFLEKFNPMQLQRIANKLAAHNETASQNARKNAKLPHPGLEEKQDGDPADPFNRNDDDCDEGNNDDGEGTSPDQIYNLIIAMGKKASAEWAELRPEMEAGAGGKYNPKYHGWSPKQFKDVILKVDAELTRGRWPVAVSKN